MANTLSMFITLCREKCVRRARRFCFEGVSMHQEIIDFGKSVGILKRTSRKGWISWVGVKDPESVADHTMRSAVIVMCLSDLRGLDTDKLLRMALLHDVHEAIIGDYDYSDKKKMGETEVNKIEKEAIRKLFAALPEPIREEYIKLADEYCLQQTREAKFVRQIDKIEMVMQALEYEKEGYNKARLQAFWDKIEPEINDTDLKRIFDLLKAERK